MLFGSISYLNLLPFQVFMKRRLCGSGARMAFGYRRNVPSRINAAFKAGRVHAAFISSVESRKCRCVDLGIIADQKVHSVFLIPGSPKEDEASASSNQLAKVLGLRGEILIGDAALKYYLSGGEGIDLAEAWHEKTGLPFVFARLCYNRNASTITKLTNEFARTKVSIPQYILKKEAKKRGISSKDLLWYLDHIEYKMDYKAKQSLKLFLRKAKNRQQGAGSRLGLFF